MMHMSPDGRPNVVLIMTDDLNAYVEGFGGHPQARTPNIARLAKEMDRHYRTCLWSYTPLDLLWVQRIVFGFDVREDWLGANIQDAVCRCNEAERCGDHVVTGANIVSKQRNMQCSGS